MTLRLLMVTLPHLFLQARGSLFPAYLNLTISF
jgi:hypothetical protein